MDDNRKKALAAALGQIEKQFGKGSVMRLGDNPMSRDIDVVSTGSIGLDVALGIGGVPKGRVVEIYGPEASGKTTLTLTAVAQAQKMGGLAAFVDVEHALDHTFQGEVLRNLVLIDAEVALAHLVVEVAEVPAQQGLPRPYRELGGGIGAAVRPGSERIA